MASQAAQENWNNIKSIARSIYIGWQYATANNSSFSNSGVFVSENSFKQFYDWQDEELAIQEDRDNVLLEHVSEEERESVSQFLQDARDFTYSPEQTFKTYSRMQTVEPGSNEIADLVIDTKEAERDYLKGKYGEEEYYKMAGILDDAQSAAEQSGEYQQFLDRHGLGGEVRTSDMQNKKMFDYKEQVKAEREQFTASHQSGVKNSVNVLKPGRELPFIDYGNAESQLQMSM